MPFKTWIRLKKAQKTLRKKRSWLKTKKVSCKWHHCAHATKRRFKNSSPTLHSPTLARCTETKKQWKVRNCTPRTETRPFIPHTEWKHDSLCVYLTWTKYRKEPVHGTQLRTNRKLWTPSTGKLTLPGATLRLLTPPQDYGCHLWV